MGAVPVVVEAGYLTPGATGVTTLLHRVTGAALALVLAALPAWAQTPPQARQCPATIDGAALRVGPVACGCTAEAVETGSGVWGTDLYTTDSATCRAARHAGAIPAEGGLAVILAAPGQRSYRGSERNGTTTDDYGPWEQSFRFARPGELTPEQVVAAASRCPERVDSDQAGLVAGQPMTCTCPAQPNPQGNVWGTLIYTTDSNLCVAALHAGAVTRRGGDVTVIPMPGRKVYRFSTRNGITSSRYGEWSSSFRFAGLAPPDPSICPELIEEREDNETGPLACTCPAEQTVRGPIFGTSTYTADSALCRAALHAGATTRVGGRITVVPMPGQESYQGSTRNGVESSTFDQSWEASLRFEGTAAAAPPTPVQAPVAHALKTLGEVHLYIQFRTNSAEIDPPALPALSELRDALRADPALRLIIVGHTDNAGGAAANRPLSQRRADAVRVWLVGQGIEAGRLRAEGRGQDQPAAENTTEVGRALNRRVQVMRVN